MCGGRIESGSESGARTGANWSRLVCPISPCAPTPHRGAPLPFLTPAHVRPLDRSINPPSLSLLSSPRATVVLHYVYLAN